VPDHSGIIPENRRLSAQERELLDWLMSNGTPEAANYVSQIDELRVIGRCKCGCPTVDFGLGDPPRGTTGGSQILADFYGITPEGIAVGVILHAREGQVSEMEIYSTAGYERPFGLPAISTLTAVWLP
jgi:hypothetical protein